jgi:hypothetical protein
MSNFVTVFSTAGSNGSSTGAPARPARNFADHASSRAARSPGARSAVVSTMSSAYRVKPYSACTCGRFQAGSSLVAR